MFVPSPVVPAGSNSKGHSRLKLEPLSLRRLPSLKSERGQAKPERSLLAAFCRCTAEWSTIVFVAKSGHTARFRRKQMRKSIGSLCGGYQVSTKGRFFSVRGLGAGSERNPVMTHERVSDGSMTSSISNSVAVLSALPRS
jgi:hypothetical protein